MRFHNEKMAALFLLEVSSLLHSFEQLPQEVACHEIQIYWLQLFRMYYHLEECSLFHLLLQILSIGQPNININSYYRSTYISWMAVILWCLWHIKSFINLCTWNRYRGSSTFSKASQNCFWILMIINSIFVFMSSLFSSNVSWSVSGSAINWEVTEGFSITDILKEVNVTGNIWEVHSLATSQYINDWWFSWSRNDLSFTLKSVDKIYYFNLITYEYVNW